MELYKNYNTLDIPGLHNYRLCLLAHKSLCLRRIYKYLHNICVEFVFNSYAFFCKESALMGTCPFWCPIFWQINIVAVVPF